MILIQPATSDKAPMLSAASPPAAIASPFTDATVKLILLRQI